jgi:glycosyltransferase involved in cell wall biosynthesis
MPARPAISIITPTYNRRLSLSRAVASVQEQTFGDYEHIIVDDGSGDGTERLVRGLGDPRIRYFRFDERRGANAARNVGIEQARAAWVTFLDSDDEYLPHRLATTARLFSLTGPELFISSFETLKRGRPRVAANPEVFLTPRELSEALVLHGIFIAGSSITVRRKALVRAGGFDVNLLRMQDRDVLLRLAGRCGGQLLADVDWIKHPSADSISAAASGYVAALGALFAAHPRLLGQYREVVAYHVARRVFSDLLSLRFQQARSGLAENLASSALRFSWGELVQGYRAGCARRRQFKVELLAREEAPAITLRIEDYVAERRFAAPALRRAA